VSTAGIAHRFLAKPCDAGALRETIHRVTTLRRILHSPDLIGIVSGLGSLPSLPASHRAIERALQCEEPSITRVGQIISGDIAMSAKILQLVNSAFFGLARRVETIEQAVTLLGTDIIRALLLSNAAFALFPPAASNFSAEVLWQHSLLVGSIASRIARAENADRPSVGQALQAGIMHDLGQLVLATRLPERYDEALELARASGVPLVEAERTVIGATHPEVGAYLLGLWGLPDSTVEAVAFHHTPSSSETGAFSPLAAVYFANVLADAYGDDPRLEERLDEQFLAAIGSTERLQCWREIAHEVMSGAVAP
jgi:HD-like signal output (HDOD) protein